MVQQTVERKRKNKRRNIFIKLIHKHIPPYTPYVTGTQQNNRKVQQKNSHQTADTKEPTCNCTAKSECPLNGSCMQNNVIYQAIVKSADNEETNTYGRKWKQ